MSKKSRKGSAPRRPAPTRAPQPAAAPAESKPAAAPEATAAESRTGLRTSPLQRSQELELEIGLAFSGAVVGGLTGYSHVPYGAAAGNVAEGALGAVLGTLLGLYIAKSLFLSVRAQWFVGGLLVVLAVGGGWLFGTVGAVVGAAIATGFLLFGLRPLALLAERHGLVTEALSSREAGPP